MGLWYKAVQQGDILSESFLAVDAILSPWLIVVLGIGAMAACLHLLWRTRERGSLILAWGCLNLAAGYLWIYLAQPAFIQRAIAIRMAIIYLLISIIYYAGRRAHVFERLFSHMRRKRERG